MKIAILSDSHDHIPNLQRAVARANQEGAEVLIHCGDLISPFMLPRLERFQGNVHLIYGNNVGDQHLISSRCASTSHDITHHGIAGEIMVDGLKIAFNHYPALARGLAATGKYDVVCCGHNHQQQVEKIGTCLLLNPGELLGKDDLPGFILFETTDQSVERIAIGDKFLLLDEEGESISTL